MNRFVPFVEWLWSKRDEPYTFRVSTLTEANRRDDASVPVPPLTMVEAENLFLYLAKKDLVLFHAATDAYIINKVDGDHGWKTAIKELKKPNWKRSAFLKKVSFSFWFIVAGLVGGFIGGCSGEIGKKFSALPFPWTARGGLADGSTQPTPTPSPLQDAVPPPKQAVQHP